MSSNLRASARDRVAFRPYGTPRVEKNQDRLKEKSMPSQCNFGRASASCTGRDLGVVRQAWRSPMSAQPQIWTKHNRQGTIAKPARFFFVLPLILVFLVRFLSPSGFVRD